MALPRYLYSINTSSTRRPLLNDDSNDQDQELAMSADAPSTIYTPPEIRVVNSDDGGGDSDKFTGEVRLNSAHLQEPVGSDVYTSARLAAAGIPDPLAERPLSEMSTDEVFSNRPEDGLRTRYGTYDGSPPLITGTKNRPPSSTSEGFGFVVYENDTKRTKHEDAALFVHEGEDNDKFIIHPRGVWSKRAYNVLHSAVYHVFNLCVCTLLLLLALIEEPSVIPEAQLSDPSVTAVIVVHALLEIILLAIVWLDLFLRFLWFRPRHFFTHKRTLLMLLVLVVMSVEAIIVLARQYNHFRITRALRPIFIIDTYLMGGVRRVLRQIFLCIKPILDVLFLLLLILVVFSLLGYLIFADSDPSYFNTLQRSLVSFFITLTTANHPDVWMEAYARQAASPIFFMVYILVMVYFISNVLLAVVYSNFSEANKEKFKKLFLHKREALRRAYFVLEGTQGSGVEFHDFLLFMHYYLPRVPEWQVMCIFKALHKDPHLQHKELSLEEFYGFYEVRDFKWKRAKPDGEELMWFENRHPVVEVPARALYMVVKSPWFNVVINIVLIANLLFLVIYTLFINEEQVASRYHCLNRVVGVSLFFVSIYVVEICLRMFTLGPVNYFRKPRNIIDCLIIVTSFILLIVEASSPDYAVLAVFRPIKFVRLLRLKRRYRDIMNTVILLSRRLLSISILLFIVFYSFSIVGMECFKESVYQNCCNESLYGVGEFFSGNNRTFSPDVYYLLNFDNVLRSYVTLFVLMVVNNWFIVMEGFASTNQQYSGLIRLYFMAFYIITLVVLQVIISFIVEAFVFRIQKVEQKRRCTKHPESHCDCHKVNERKKRVVIKLLSADIDKLRYEMTYNDEVGGDSSFSKFVRHRRRVSLPDKSSQSQDSQSPASYMLTYTGRRLRTKDDIYLLMYRSDLTVWIRERDAELEQANGEQPKRPWWKKLVKFFTNCVLYIIE